MTLVLASTSPTRVKLLSDAGVVFETERPGVDEEAVKAGLLAEGAGPREVADALAELKAVRVSARRGGDLVIGADQTLDLDGALLSKAETVGQLRDQLLALRGRAHALHSAVVAAREGAAVWREVKTARLHVRAFSPAFLDDYLAREGQAVLGCLGGYRAEGPGLQLFERIEGDLFTVLGLPLLGLLRFLREQGELVS